MTSEELAKAVQEFSLKCGATKGLVELASNRILGIGDAQYTQGDCQTFELIPMEQLITMFKEELADVLVYMVMIMLRQPFNRWVAVRFTRFGGYLGALFHIALRIRIV